MRFVCRPNWDKVVGWKQLSRLEYTNLISQLGKGFIIGGNTMDKGELYC